MELTLFLLNGYASSRKFGYRDVDIKGSVKFILDDAGGFVISTGNSPKHKLA